MRTVIPDTVYGLPGIAFGGYVAGLAALDGIPGPTRIDFRRPVPLGEPLELHDFVEASPWVIPDAIPDLPTWVEANDAASRFGADDAVSHPDCFGCGPRRVEGSGLRIFTGRARGRSCVAAPWTPAPSFTDGRTLRREFMWSALDCPGAWARKAFGEDRRPAVTAYLAADIRRDLRVGERGIVAGWLQEQEGRKSVVGVAITSADDGDLCAISEALWVSNKE